MSVCSEPEGIIEEDISPFVVDSDNSDLGLEYEFRTEEEDEDEIFANAVYNQSNPLLNPGVLQLLGKLYSPRLHSILSQSHTREQLANRKGKESAWYW